ncbi:hypothetical protein ABT095_15925 [Kitasatospora sp. NPDC002227]|uniref:hypothetical protein n=1 Tax=Kitasatospora sp. NPDC002227 TaxID=3154773 RepID=UPI0033300B6F
MAFDKDAFLTQIDGLTVMELNDLVRAFGDKFGIPITDVTSDNPDETVAEASNSKGPAPVQYKPTATEPALVPADQVKPEDIATLSIEYREGQPVIVVRGGRAVPATLAITGPDGNVVAAYTAGPVVDSAGTARLLTGV